MLHCWDRCIIAWVHRKTKQRKTAKAAKQSKANFSKPMYKSTSLCASRRTTRRQQIKAPHARQTCQSNLNNTNVLKQRAQVRHTNHSKAWQSKASTGKPMYKSPPSCAPHLRTSPFHLPRLVRVSLDKFYSLLSYFFGPFV